ncbi:hypothetical protein K438DRAFT_1818858 [Mycena galopus ATCC 62051]|nr:hypothetical protein K438DRAFT_1818858 [Mycena galopus ATCC 62051]
MFSAASLLAVLALALHASAHAMPSPALGVLGAPTRADVQRPSTSQPCGTVPIASNIDNSTALPTEADGTTVTMNVTNFNSGADGSRSVSVTVDPTGTGKSTSFVKATVSKNGNANPTSDGTDKVTLSLPKGTKCTGGTAGNLCLLSVKTTAGFGACVVVSQLDSASTASGSAVDPSASPTTAAAAAAATPTAGGPPFDPAGIPNVGNGRGIQFIGGQCLSAADCASGCCAGPSGICSGVGAQTQAGKTGCGFVSSAAASGLSGPATTSAAPDAPAATKTTASAASTSTSTTHAGPPFDPAGIPNVGNSRGIQFIGGQCLSAADCASGCCAGPAGICSGLGAQTQAGKTGCGFVSSAAASGLAGSATTKATSAAADAPAVTGKVPCTSSRKRRGVGTRAPRAARHAQGLHANPLFASIPL